MKYRNWIDVPQSDEIPVDLMDTAKCQLQGMFYQSWEVNGILRRMLTYVPEGFCHNNRCIIAAGPEKISPEDFLNKSGLGELADRESILVCIIEPLNETWCYDGSDADFMNSAYKRIQNRQYFVVMQDCIYAMGFDEGTAVAHQAAIKMASEWSGLATFGDIPELTDIFHNESEDSDAGSQTEEMFISGKRAQLPVWMLFNKENSSIRLLSDYWKKENHSQSVPMYLKDGTMAYLPEYVKDTWKVNDDNIAQMRMTSGVDVESLSYDQLSSVWDYIGSARRHRGYGNKVLRYFRDPLKHGATYHKMEVDGMMREWYEYVPKRFINTDKKLPVVIAFHGRGGNGETFFDITDLSLVAEERGFIALFPTADIYQIREGGFRGVRLWNGKYYDKRIDSLNFVRKMIEDVEGRLNVDRKRIYACGQSSGGYMTTYCALAASDIFAAVAPWSGFTCPGLLEMFAYNRETCFENGPVPIQLLVGKDDNFFGQEQVVDLTEDTQLNIFIRFILYKYGLENTPMQYSCAPIDYTVWTNKAGIPMLTVGLVNDMPHANYPEESWISYDQFLCKYEKDEDGNRFYMGKLIK